MSAPFTIEERQRLLDCGNLCHQFPITMGDDGSQWRGFTGYCAKCHEPIRDEWLFGEVSAAFKGVWSIRCVGYCLACKVTTCFSYNFRSDGTVTGYNANGEWCRWKAEPVPIWKQCVRFLTKIIT